MSCLFFIQDKVGHMGKQKRNNRESKTRREYEKQVGYKQWD